MNLDEAKQAYAGITVAAPAPTTPDGEIDVDAFRRNLTMLVDRGLKRGVGVVLAGGAAAEFPMLTTEQRKLLMRVAIETVGDRVGVAASVQSPSTRQAIELASYAQSIGIIGGQLSAPQYYRPTADDIYHYYKDIADQSGLPIIVYTNWWHIPEFNAKVVDRLAEIDGVVAVKWSAPSDEDYLAGYHTFGDRLAIVDNAGRRLQALQFGAIGVISHIANFWPEYSLQMWQLMLDGKADELEEFLAFKRAFRAWEMRVAAFTQGEGPPIKTALAEIGLPSGEPLPPGRSVPESLRQDVRDLFREYSVPRADAVVG